jgi:hypothetical protein
MIVGLLLVAGCGTPKRAPYKPTIIPSTYEETSHTELPTKESHQTLPVSSTTINRAPQAPFDDHDYLDTIFEELPQ